MSVSVTSHATRYTRGTSGIHQDVLKNKINITCKFIIFVYFSSKFGLNFNFLHPKFYFANRLDKTTSAAQMAQNVSLGQELGSFDSGLPESICLGMCAEIFSNSSQKWLKKNLKFHGQSCQYHFVSLKFQQNFNLFHSKFKKKSNFRFRFPALIIHDDRESGIVKLRFETDSSDCRRQIICPKWIFCRNCPKLKGKLK